MGMPICEDWPAPGTVLNAAEVQDLHGLYYVHLCQPDGPLRVMITDALYLTRPNGYAGAWSGGSERGEIVPYDTLAELLGAARQRGCTVWDLRHLPPDDEASHHHYYPLKS